MTFQQYWNVLVRRWKLILMCFLVVGLGAYIGSKLMTPLYRSTALVQVVIRSTSVNSQGDYNNLLASDQLVQTESQLVVSTSVLREVASHYPNMTVRELLREVSSAPRLNTQLFEIDVQDASPARAAALANDIIATLIKQQQQRFQHDNSQSQQQMQQDLRVTQQSIQNITTQISALQLQRGSQNQLTILQTQLTNLQQHSNQQQVALTQLNLSEAQNSNFLDVVQSAQPELIAAQPDTLLNTGAGFLVGLLLGILLALLFEQLDTRVRTPEALTQLLNWPILATVWRANSSKREGVINPKGHDINIEAYRILRTNIGFSVIDKPLRSLIVTSAMPRDGKSAIAANLAIFMAKAGKNTLLIDADLRRPTQHTLFGLSADKMGLSNAILSCSMPGMPNTPSKASSMPGRPNTSPYRQLHATSLEPLNTLTTTNFSLEPFVHSVDIPNLWVMPTGPLPPNPSELLDSKAMQRFLTVIANCGFEIVIFDSPPLLGLSDASILAAKVDSALVVIDTTRSTKGKLKQMKAVLAQTGTRVLGCVANKQRHSRNDTAYSYYYSYRTVEQNSEEKHARNGHAPTVPFTPSPPVSPSPFELCQLKKERGQIRASVK